MRRLYPIVAMLLAAVAYGLGTDDVLFYAPFDGSADAAMARGDGTAEAAVPCEYIPGVLGQAIVVGSPPDQLAETKSLGVGYHTHGNVLREQGSVAVWVQALDWEVGDGKNHRFVTFPGQGVTFYFYVFYPGNTWWLLLKKSGNRPIGGWVPRWKPGEWHHLVATWRDGEMAVFVDGKQSGRATEDVPLPEKLADRFWLGNFREPRSAFDELTIFRRPLATAEVTALYSKGAAPPQPASAVVSDSPDTPAQFAGLLDDVTGQVVLDEDVTCAAWADDKALHLKLRWAIPEYFRRDPTAYSARALRRGSERTEDNDTFEVRAGQYRRVIGPDGDADARSSADMDEWIVGLDVPKQELGGATFDLEVRRHWRELRRLDATWRGRVTLKPGVHPARVGMEGIRGLAANVPNDTATNLDLRVGELYRARLPFVRATPFSAVLRHFPSNGRLLVEVSDPEAEVTFTGQTRTGAGEHTFDVSAVPVGEHEVTVRAGGAAKELAFTKQPVPDWLSANAGVSDGVPPPWVPLEVDREAVTVKCWGRNYGLAGLLPQQIDSQGRPLLAAPVRLRAGDGVAEGKPTAIDAQPARATVESTGGLGDGTVHVRTTIEFDGYMWFDVSLAPSAAGPMELPSLVLEIPMRPERATLLYSGNYTCKDTGLLPEDGYTGQWRHRFWVGDEAAGIQWFAESREGWRLSKPEEALQVRDGLIRLAIVDTATTLAKPLTVSFGLMATPVRPRPASWRSWRFGRDEVNRDGWQYVSLWNTHWGTRWNYPVLKPRTPDYLRGKYAAGELPCLYCNATAFSPNTPEYRYWHEEWRVAPSARVDFASLPEDDENAHASVCPKSTFTEFFVRALERAIRDADIRGLYFDVSDAPSCRNESHRCGWRDDDGELHETVALRATREFQKRVYTVAKQHRPDFLVSIHMSGNIFMPQHSFCDVMIDGENFTSILQRQWAEKRRGDYFDFIRLDTMRAEFMLHNFGPVPAFLPEFARSLGHRWWSDDPEVMKAARHLVGLFTLHDAPMWQAYMPTMVLRDVWYAQSRFGWDEKVEFIPYWRNGDALTLVPETPGVAASVFKRPRRMMVVAMNNTGEDVDIQLSWNAAELGLEGIPFVRIEDFLTGGWWRIKDGAVPPIPLPARGFRMLVPLPPN